MQLLSGVNVCCRNDHEYAVERGYKETYAAFGQAQECDGYDERHRCSDCGVAAYDVLELVFADHVACRKEYAVVDGVAQSYQSYVGDGEVYGYEGGEQQYVVHSHLYSRGEQVPGRIS